MRSRRRPGRCPEQDGRDRNPDDDDEKHGVHNLGAILRQARSAREQLARLPTPQRLFTVGGDCGVEVVPVSYVNRHFERCAVVWFDAHADLNTLLRVALEA